MSTVPTAQTSQTPAVNNKPAPIAPSRAVQLLSEDDPSFLECDLSGNATYAMKSAAFTKEIGLALKKNTKLTKLSLSNLGITDTSVKFIADALRENKTLTYLNLSKNKFGSPGLIDLADAITFNSTLLEIDLLGQSQQFGDQALSKVIQMFSHNITLKNIGWRLNSRQSFAINKLIVRNNEIERRLATGKSVLDILPEARKVEYGGTPGEVTDTPGDTESTKISDENSQVPNSPSTPHSTGEAKPKPAPNRSVTAAPALSNSKEVKKPPTTTTTIPPKPQGGGKMLSRYLQAAQAVDAPKEPEQGKKIDTTSGWRGCL